MRLYLINPHNPSVTLTDRSVRWNEFRVWKPLGLLVLAGLTPPHWDVKVIDENLGRPDYSGMPGPDLVGITAFTAQAPRAYDVARAFRDRGVPVVMGGIHASMCADEALRYVDAVVTGEAEGVWRQVLEDARNRSLKRLYVGTPVSLAEVPPARHDLLADGYRLGSIQTTRGCPLNCSFCSVTAFNGGRFRHRPIEKVIEELELVSERYVLVVDDNLVGTRRDHIERTKELFRAMIRADLGKRWIAQATINMADDEELMDLAVRAGCLGVFIGFESTTAEGLSEVHKRFNIKGGRDLRASVRRLQRHGIMVVGSFILGLDVDSPGAGRRIAEAAGRYGIDALTLLILTPLPGTRLWDKMAAEGRILANDFPRDWSRYTLASPVARHSRLSWEQIIAEEAACSRAFYSYSRIVRRALGALWRTRSPLAAAAGLLGNLSYRANMARQHASFQGRDLTRGASLVQVRRAETPVGVRTTSLASNRVPSGSKPAVKQVVPF